MSTIPPTPPAEAEARGQGLQAGDQGLEAKTPRPETPSDGASTTPPAPDETAEAPAPSPSDASPVAPAQSPLVYWARPLILGLLVVILLILNRWDQTRLPDRPLGSDLLRNAPVAAPATGSSADPALLDTLHRARLALERRDTRAMANLADPTGLIVASYAMALPDSGYTVADVARLLQDVGAPAGKLEVLGWRPESGGRAALLTQGWQRRPLRLNPNSTLETTPVIAFGFVQRGSVWYWRVLAVDATGALGQQARAGGWQAPP